MGLSVSILGKRAPVTIERNKLIVEGVERALNILNELEIKYEVSDISQDFRQGMSFLSYVSNSEDLSEYEVICNNNITHNLSYMAKAVSEDFYKALWRPYELFDLDEDKWKETPVLASSIVQTVKDGYQELKKSPEKYRPHTPSNGYGTYEGLVNFVWAYFHRLENNPNGIVITSR
jgi:hypothetical protein